MLASAASAIDQPHGAVDAGHPEPRSRLGGSAFGRGELRRREIPAFFVSQAGSIKWGC
jgi:hypothetical protein